MNLKWISHESPTNLPRIPINKVGMNGVVKVMVAMEYPNDQPRDLPHLPVQIEGLLDW